MPAALLPYDLWMKQTSLGMFRSRGAPLEAFDRAYKALCAAKTRQTVEAADRAMLAYQAAVPNWESSARNTGKTMSSVFFNLADESSLYMEQRSFVWSPRHEEQTIIVAAREMRSGLRLHADWQGGTGTDVDLGKFSMHARMFVLAHGHGEMPCFTINKVHYSPQQMAEMLRKHRLRREHANITMLVCHAGESVNTQASGNALFAVAQRLAEINALLPVLERQMADGVRGAGEKVTELEAEKRGLSPKYDAIRSGRQGAALQKREPAHFDAFASTQPAKDSMGRREAPRTVAAPAAEGRAEDQLLPLAAQFSAALKQEGFCNFTLTSFKAPVQNIPREGKIVLDLSHAFEQRDPRLAPLNLTEETAKHVPVDSIRDWVAIWK